MVYLGIVEGLLISRESLGLAESPSLALERVDQFLTSSSLALACQASSTKSRILWLPETPSLALTLAPTLERCNQFLSSSSLALTSKSCQASTKPWILGLVERVDISSTLGQIKARVPNLRCLSSVQQEIIRPSKPSALVGVQSSWTLGEIEAWALLVLESEGILI